MEAPANLTSVGVFVYSTVALDGTMRDVREYRPPEEVFAPESLATLRGAPLVEGHPAFIDAANWRTFAIGHVADDVAPSSIYATGTLRVSDGRAQADLQSDDLREISCGYFCDQDDTPGVTPDGEVYDVVQRNIRYNHVGLGPANWGRQGPNVRVLLDSVCGPAANDIGISHYDTDMMSRIRQFRADSLRAPVPPVAPAPGGNGAPHAPSAVRADAGATPTLTLEVDVVALERQRQALATEKEELLTKISTLEAEKLALQAPISEALEAERLDAKIVELATLREDCTSLGVTFERTDSARVLRTKALAKLSPTVHARLDAKASSETVTVAFDAALAAYRGAGGSSAKTLAALDSNARKDGGGSNESPIAIARERHDARTYGRPVRAFGEARPVISQPKKDA